MERHILKLGFQVARVKRLQHLHRPSLDLVGKGSCTIECDGEPVDVETGVLLNCLRQQVFQGCVLKNKMEVYSIARFGASVERQELIDPQIRESADPDACLGFNRRFQSEGTVLRQIDFQLLTFLGDQEFYISRESTNNRDPQAALLRHSLDLVGMGEYEG